MHPSATPFPRRSGSSSRAPLYRPVVFVGDGAFQMTGQELSTIIRRNLNPVIFLLNNDGYQVERVIYDNAYNDLQMWDYTLMPEAYGGKGPRRPHRRRSGVRSEASGRAPR